MGALTHKALLGAALGAAQVRYRSNRAGKDPAAEAASPATAWKTFPSTTLISSLL